jgi:hypothetical protein
MLRNPFARVVEGTRRTTINTNAKATDAVRPMATSAGEAGYVDTSGDIVPFGRFDITPNEDFIFAEP